MTQMRRTADGDLAREPNLRPSPVAPWPFYAADERAAVTSVLESGKVNYWTGQEGRLFEREYSAYLGVAHAIALANGSVALELPLRMWEIGPGDEVVVTPRSFIASATCAMLVGARPVFADVDRDSGNLTAETIARVITPRTRAIVPVHLGGWPCEMDAIMSLAEEHGIKVLEDCAQAHGATYRDRPVGSIGHAAAYSFCQDKIISTAGEGGLMVTSDDALWDRCWSFKDHGKTWESVYEREHGPGFRWVHDRIGTNWRLTEVQSAVGRIQLRKLDAWVDRRRSHATILGERLRDAPALRIPEVPGHIHQAPYRFYAYVRPEALKTGWTRQRLLQELGDLGVPCFTGSCSEIYRERALQGTESAPHVRLQVAGELGETSLAFLVHPTLDEGHIHKWCDVISAVLARATR